VESVAKSSGPNILVFDDESKLVSEYADSYVAHAIRIDFWLSVR